ncbi:hypothetical protein BDV25DRAFT_71194 [Aspergillus avenaceus]|uniref:Uncharacterized protein n=1 Tax=Aspergillus avenaceus TaxID=36643 RepID=A0A5N6TH42_ASPAV|nr:hypothetical protein BDV25DRAFT_71194 [Aspergillus avenaceus]
MTEPEDVEEDLFADLYDADDTAHQATSAIEAPRVSESTAPISTQPVGFPVPSTHETHDEYNLAHTTYQQLPEDGVYQNGPGNLDSGFAANAPPPAVEAEHHGTGIKEDG